MTPLHGIASRSDLPLPFESVVAGAAVVLLATFYILFFAWKEHRYADDDGTPMPRLTKVVDSAPLRIAIRTLAGLVWLVAAIALVFGPDRIDNPVVGFIYVWLWVGLVVLSVFLGRAYRATNPVRSLLAPFGATRAEDAPQSRWPAALAMFGFLYMELVLPGGVTLPVLRGAAALWIAWCLVGYVVRPGWIERADPFEVYASTVAPLSPWRRKDGVIQRMNPVRNLASWAPPIGTWVVAVVLLGGTAFDAMSNTPWWQRMTQSSPVPGWVLGTVGLPVVIALVLGLYALGCRFLDEGEGLVATMNRLSPGLVPLVVGYCIAHYGTYFYLEGQRTGIRFNDPLGRGDNWFGFAEAAPNVDLFAFPVLVAWVQVLLIVGGHVLGVIVTHDVALRRPAGRVMRQQLPLLLVMVFFTMAGLLLMFGA
ncbi:hypothetical protein [uncultured Tessaracoccus sp.]|uniref:hypothetical protein n=1 Tax=uncultured Tessaracoccus sp. TaxID=905023 RepID=UPI0025E7C4CA|nr:hypothetical protein [uncultured Tessaracoccus sp.]